MSLIIRFTIVIIVTINILAQKFNCGLGVLYLSILFYLSLKVLKNIKILMLIIYCGKIITHCFRHVCVVISTAQIRKGSFSASNEGTESQVEH